MKLPFTLIAIPSELETLSSKADLKKAHKNKELDSIHFRATVYVHDTDRLKSPVILNEEELEPFASSFIGQPFLIDHARKQGSRWGTIRESMLVEKEGKKTISQMIEAVTPEAITGVLNGTVDRFSIGWDAEEYICTICKDEFGGPKCEHDFFDLGGKTKDGTKIRVLMKGLEGTETSAVTHPASVGTSTDGLSALQEFRMHASGMSPERKKEVSMLQKVLQLLGLSANTAEPEALSALEARLSQAPPGIPKALKMALGVAEEASEDQTIAAATALTAPGVSVPRSEFEQLQQKMLKYEAADRVRKAKAEGKISPAMESWALKFAMDTPAAFDAWVASAPMQIPINQPPPVTEPITKTGAHGLTMEELMVARRMGRSPEEFAKAKADALKYDTDHGLSN